MAQIFPECLWCARHCSRCEDSSMSGTDKSPGPQGAAVLAEFSMCPAGPENDSLSFWSTGLKFHQQSGITSSHGTKSCPQGSRNIQSSLECNCTGILDTRMVTRAEAGRREQNILMTHAVYGLNCVPPAPTEFLRWSPHPSMTVWSKEVIKVQWGHEGGALIL